MSDDEEFCDINALPWHIIVQILSNLNISDLKSATLTCRLWYDLSYESWLNKKVYVKLSHMQLIETDPTVEQIMTHSRYFTGLSLNFVKCNPLYTNFWEKFGYRLTELNLIYVSLRTEVLFEMLQHMPKLKSLHLNGNGVLFTSLDYNVEWALKQNAIQILSQLETLRMRIKMTNETFDHFFGDIRQLKDFEYVDNSYFRRTVPGTALTGSSFIRFINKNVATLEYLRLQIDVCDGSLIAELLNMTRLNLKSFHILKLDCGNEIFEALCKQQCNIETFEAKNLNAQHITSISTNFKKLRELIVENSPEAVNGLHEIRQLSNLETLCLCDVGNISEELLVELLGDNRHKMYSLRLKNCITSKGLTRITEVCPNLKELHLSYDNATPKRGIQKIFENLVHLEILSIIQSGQHEDIESDEYFGYPISRLKNLNILFVDGIQSLPGVNNEEFKELKNLVENGAYLSMINQNAVTAV